MVESTPEDKFIFLFSLYECEAKKSFSGLDKR
jgi:hypothetical protein